MIEGFENEEAYARMNYLIDVIRGNLEFKVWKELSQHEKDLYLKEAKDSEYIILNSDVDDIEEFILLAGLK